MEKGFYWLRYLTDGEWEPAEFDGAHWWVLGSDMPMPHSAAMEVGAKIERGANNSVEVFDWALSSGEVQALHDGKNAEAMRATRRAAEVALDIARGALADIANSRDMTLDIARAKSARIYAETGPTE